MNINTKIPKLRRFVLQNFPFIESDFDAITDYQLICKVVEYLNSVIQQTNNLTDATVGLIDAFNELKAYVENYFDTLDVQEEINNKLEAMVEDGTLQEIITAYIQSNVTWTFDTVAEMLSATNLIAGSFAKTQGYYEIGDGGGAEYVIVSEEPSDSIYETLNSGLYAKMIINNRTIYTKQTGAKGDGTTDDTTKIQSILTLIKNVYPDKFTIIVNGLHFVQPSLELRGTADNRITNVTIKGSDANRDYWNFDGIKDGFIFDTTDHFAVAGFNSTFGLSIIYTTGFVVENLKLTTNESVGEDEIPLNNIVGLRLYDARCPKVRECNITKFYTGCWQYNGGISYIKNNNFALCNIGYRTSYVGDSTIEDNYFNTIGSGIYNLDGTLKSRYAELYSNNLVFAMAAYFGDGGNITVRGGKVEWCNIGFWQDYGTNMIYDSIQFDRCTLAAMSFSGHNRPNVNSSILNCNFTGCGAIAPIGDNIDKHLGGYTGATITASNAYGLTISNCHFTGDNGRLTGAFKTSGVYYAPLFVLYFKNVYQSSFVNNTIQVDAQYAYRLENTELCYNNNICNKAWSMNANCCVYRPAGIKREFYHDNPSTITDGNFDYNDMVYSQNALVTGWRVTVAGSAQTINTNVSVVTVATDYYPGDGSVIDLGSSIPSGVRTGAYVTIAGVTGVKKIVGVIQNNNKFFAKLDTACDVAVLNAAMANQAPTFTSLS